MNIPPRSGVAEATNPARSAVGQIAAEVLFDDDGFDAARIAEAILRVDPAIGASEALRMAEEAMQRAANSAEPNQVMYGVEIIQTQTSTYVQGMWVETVVVTGSSGGGGGEHSNDDEEDWDGKGKNTTSHGTIPWCQAFPDHAFCQGEDDGEDEIKDEADGGSLSVGDMCGFIPLLCSDSLVEWIDSLAFDTGYYESYYASQVNRTATQWWLRAGR